MKRNFIILAAILGALAVILGAFGAHALKARLTAGNYKFLKQAYVIIFIMFCTAAYRNTI